ncbi:hypothetical protein [Lysinibacter sp. HNR]|uniref:hypothetical protein n=1 Tax=Lysinibacter sp. HNR TaxID=3031408 RepID=UPI0024348F18|nr:hypothetical protein [Lysinibacter sp. HNR]WGD36386.1 hypothetical protein FrondiHNR_07815 [Lysinibacter sp. HNR]
MELIFIVVIGLVIGLAARYFIPGRHTYGVGAQLGLGAAVASAVWVLLTVAGMPWDGFWIWAITPVITAGACTAYGIVVPRLRLAHDETRHLELSRA